MRDVLRCFNSFGRMGATALSEKERDWIVEGLRCEARSTSAFPDPRIWLRALGVTAEPAPELDAPSWPCGLDVLLYKPDEDLRVEGLRLLWSAAWEAVRLRAPGATTTDVALVAAELAAPRALVRQGGAEQIALVQRWAPVELVEAVAAAS